MKKQQIRKNRKKSLKKSPVFLIALLNFLIIITILIYIIYIRFIPYETITYDGYAVSGKDLVNNLLNSTFEVKEILEALEVKDQDEIYKNIKSYYVGVEKKKNINLDYPIYVNDTLALYNLSKDTLLYTDTLKTIEGYAGFTLTSGALYNANTLERADYHNYILMKNADGMYINTKEIKINTSNNKYTIKMNSIMNITDEFITYYTLKDGKFVYGKILDLDFESKVKIKDYNKEYTYEEFLIGLEIIRPKEESEDKKEENEVKVEKVEKENTKNEENSQENTTENGQKNTVGNDKANNENVDDSNGDTEIDTTPTKWKKPEVSCTDFIPNVYSAITEISISDPSNAINKAIIYTFYNNGEIEFRVSATSSGTLKVTKLKPNTKYEVIGTYQYTNEKGKLIEVEFHKQEMITLNTSNIRPIELTLKNGQIYPNKIEIIDLGIISDLEDEAICGVSRAEIEINGAKYSISTKILRNILNGEKEVYQSSQLEANTKYKYEIKFYDVAGNEMKLNNNTGATVTSKAEPHVSIRVINNITSVKLKLNLSNKDDVKLNNYRYVLYSETGEIIRKEELSEKTDYLNYDDLKADTLYTIKIYSDFDIEDGNGFIENREIGSSTFITSSLEKLGSLKLNLDYDEYKDITDNSINFNAKINTIKTDARLIKILNEIKIDIVEKNSEIPVKTFYNKDISSLISDDGVDYKVENLESNTEYEIVITATAKQGNEIKDIKTTYTLTSFKTNKKKANFYITNEVVTTNMIDLKVKVEDIDGASLNGKYIIELREWDKDLKEEGSLIRKDEINANDIYKEMTYNDLEKEKSYVLICYAKQYNENNNNNILKNYEIGRKTYETTGLEGNVELIGLNRISNNKNLIDVESNNKWYSECFDVLNTSYEDKGETKEYKEEALRNYGKTYNANKGELTLTSNQCYVYNLKEYAGKKVAMSFKAKVSSSSIAYGIYIQKGKELGKNIEQLEDISTSYKKYTYIYDVPEDGYLGFYLSKDSSEKLIIKDLQVELGEEVTDYESYDFNLNSKIEVTVIDKKKVTYSKDDGMCKYWIRIIKNVKTEGNEEQTIEDIEYNEKSSDIKSYEIDKNDVADYEIQLLIKLYGKEYILDTVNFKYDPSDYKEIDSISKVEEFLDIQPNGNYRILKNLDLTNSTTTKGYTFGNAQISFNGNIDFNGKTITKNIYNENKERNTSYMFYKISETASIDNIVIDFKINTIEKLYDISEEDGLYSLFLYNKGSIDNVMINLKECYKQDQRYIGLLGYKNEGTISNFVIDLQNTLYCSQYTSGLCLYSSGVIQNGYMFGEDIEVIDYVTQDASRCVGGIVYKLTTGNGLMQNIYNISGITINHHEKTDSYAANIVYNVGKNSQVRNIYSTKEYKVKYNENEYKYLLSKENKTSEQKGPNVLDLEEKGNVSESYYFTLAEYANNDANKRQEQSLLLDSTFQNYLLNANNQNQFLIDGYVEEEIYPQLNLNKCMPNQTKNPIEIDDTNNVIDILSAKIIEYDDIEEEDKKNIMKPENYGVEENVKIAIFKIYNSYGLEISDIEIQALDNDILYQNKEENITKLYAVVYDPLIAKNDYNYNILSVSCKNSWGRIYTVQYDGDRSVYLQGTFVKYINSIDDWKEINGENYGVSGLTQNYKLTTDLDFSGIIDCQIKNKEYTFSGTIDGQNHKISNIELSDSLIGRVSSSGCIKNLKVENYKVKSTANTNVGLIGTARGRAVIDNVHITNTNLYTSGGGNIGGIVGYLREGASIKNSSVNELEIKLDNEGKKYSLGGIVGDGTQSTYIENCYVNKLNIETNGNIISGIGGIIGICEGSYGGVNIKYCYSNGAISTDAQCTGGILGKCGFGLVYGCWSSLDIICNLAEGDAYVGGIVGYQDNLNKVYERVYKNIYFGNIWVNNEVNTYGRIVGNYTNTTKNYGYKNQIINGVTKDDELGAKKLLNTSEIYDVTKYYDDNILGCKKNEIYNENYYFDGKSLPKLKNTDTGDELPNQVDVVLKENPLEVKGVEFSDVQYDGKDAIEIKITIYNSNKYEITNIDIENMTIASEIVQNEDTRKYNMDVVTFTAVPNKYYDSYDLISLSYKKTTESNEEKLDSLINIKKSFYKYIYNLNDWNDITEDFENYRLMGDIYVGNNDIGTNKKIGRLISDEEHVISGKTSIEYNEIKTLNEPLINGIASSLKNVKFENFKVNSSGLIESCNAKVDNCTFSNITIEGLDKSKVGIISNCSTESGMLNIKLNHITVYGNAYVGGLCGYISSINDFENITGEYIKVKANGNYAGGIFGYIIGGGKINNICAYQSDENGNIDNYENDEFLVSGINYIGGCVGYSESEINIAKTKGSRVIGSKFVGGCIGYATNNKLEITSCNNGVIGSYYVGGCIGLSSNTSENITSSNNIINATENFVGGCIGQSAYTTDAKSNDNIITGLNQVGGCVGRNGYNAKNLNSNKNTIKGKSQVGGCIGVTVHYPAINNTASNNEIEATGNDVGGCIGTVENGISNSNIRSINNKISSTGNNVGGCIGYTKGQITNAKTEYDAGYTETMKIKGNDCVGGIVGKNTYTKNSGEISESSINEAYVNNAKIEGTGNVGGISGYQNGSLYGVGVNGSIIIAQKDGSVTNCVGGLVGEYNSSTSSIDTDHDQNAKFYLKNSFCTNSYIQADQNVGGLVGKYKYGNIQYCYVGNTNVYATKENAGGFIGCLDNEDTNNKQFIFKMSYCFIASNETEKTVEAEIGAGGIIGSTSGDIADNDMKNNLRDNIHNILVVTDVVSTTDYVSPEIGRVVSSEKKGDTQSEYMTKIYVYANSKIKGANIDNTAEELKQDNTYKYQYEVLTSADLADKSIYSNTDKLNFGSSEYDNEDGYFPRLTASTYWGSSYLNVEQPKISIPTDNINSEEQNTYSLATLSLNLEDELPEVYAYAVDVDKINIEFSYTNPYTYFEVKTNDDISIIEKTEVQDRVYTLEYDFNTTLKIKVSNLENWYNQEIEPDEVKNLLDIVNDEYMYLLDNTLYSSKREKIGEFVNIYKGKALNANGDIYNISDMSIIDRLKNKFKLQNDKVSIFKFKYNDVNVETYYHCSKVTQNDGTYTYKEQQIFIKNGEIYLIDGNMKNIGNAVIIDSYNNNQYETTLGTDGKLYDLLKEIKYPDSFKNEDIIAMTNNVDNNNNIILVYYSTGKVIGFNYITGEQVYDNNVNNNDQNIISYMLDSLSLDKALYEIEEKSYDDAKALSEKLEKVSIKEALEEIKGNNEQEEKTTYNKEENKSEYITTYNPKTQSYDVYSSLEIFGASVTPMESENEKINNNSELISYYTNMSKSRTNLKNIGIIILSIIISTICVILIVMYKKNYKENRLKK